ncbi:IS630 family transposase [Streptomyces sp. NPDC001250]|uniref:IS630 family transposase n=1 Tax=Streptomyces sp. NPDC001250 TaxID=3154382 RepID=UPI003321F7D6
MGQRCKLSTKSQVKLAAMLNEDPAAFGWDEDQVWTGARVAKLIGRKLHVSYSADAAARLIRRLGFTPQMPARRAAQRDELAIAAWKETTWPAVKGHRSLGAFVCFEDEAGQHLTPPRGRTWGRRGQSPIVKVAGRSSGRVSIAGVIAVRPGARMRLIYRVRIHRGRKNERRSLSERDYIGLIDAAHQQLRAPIILVWDRLNTHVSATMKQMIAERAWLTVVLLPAHAPDLNPVEGVWSHVKRSLANLAALTVDALEKLIRNRLKRLQYRPVVLDGFVAETGLTFDPLPP